MTRTGECECCKREKPLPARGLCGACYQRWRKTGSTEYQRWGHRAVCGVGGCNSQLVSHGLCDKHRQRLRKHGHIEQTRPDCWGVRRKHPLYNSWARLMRYRGQAQVCREWQDDFLQFAMDVGERPSKKHKFFAADETIPIGPNNFVWKRSITEKVEGEDDKTYRARQQRVYRRLSKEAHKGYALKSNYGISYECYDNMLISQGFACAICQKSETTVIRGQKIGLSVDHCHETGEVRGLLCRKCNQGIGIFEHDADWLRAAALYCIL